MDDQLVIPVQTCKLPAPRDLLPKETREIKDLVYRAYNKQLNAASLLEHGNIKKQDDEEHMVFYERLYNHYYQHLSGANLATEGYTTGENWDVITMSHANLIAMIWLERLDRHLPKFVAKEFGTEL